MSASWQLKDLPAETVESLSAGLSVQPITARCLVARGVDSVDAGRAFLEPRLAELRPPRGLAGLTAAIDRLAAALERGERIGIFGDYDVDGVTTAALLCGTLQALGGDCEVRVARRDRGYGFGDDDAAELAEAGCRLIVTGDCGTSDAPTIARLAARGIDTVVIDHHTVPAADPENPHPACALINPFRADSEFPFRGLASVGLAFYVMAALRSRLRSNGWFDAHPEPDLREQLDLVALGTIADLVPLASENRILVRAGLDRLAHSQRPGIRALMDHAGLAARDLDERAISWKLAPRLNAPGRLGNARPALDVLLAATPAVARAAAAEVEQINEQRRIVQSEVMDAALAQIGDADPGPAVVVAGRGWSAGVAGIVAARLVDRFQRPAFVIAIDEAGVGRGSCRTCGDVDVYQVLSSARESLVRYGGHAAAAGLTLHEKDIPRFREQVAAAVARGADDLDVPARRVLAVDAEVDLEALTPTLVAELDALSPFGQHNDEPLLCARRVKVRGTRRVGDGSHLKLDLVGPGGRTLSAIAFGQGGDDPGANTTVDLAFRPVVSTWGGRKTLELQVQALAPARSRSVASPPPHAAALGDAPNL